LNLPFRKFKDELNRSGFISKRIVFDNGLLEEVAKEPLITTKTNFRIDDFEKQFDGCKLYNRLWPELYLSSKMRQLVKYPWLFNLVINKASRSKRLQVTISYMVEDIEMRNKLKDPRFYLKIPLE
jgi:hypothetical protein